jgi:hypothetical protein
VADLHILLAESAEGGGRALGQSGVTLDGPDLTRDASGHGGGISRSGAHLQHPVAGAQLECLQHEGHDVGLGDRLATGDGERGVLVGKLGEVRGEKFLPRHDAHGGQDGRISNPPGHEMVPNHHLTTLPCVRHCAPLSSPGHPCGPEKD